MRNVLFSVLGLLFAALIFGFGASNAQARTVTGSAAPAVSHTDDHAHDLGSGTNSGSPLDDDDDDDDSAAADSTECVAPAPLFVGTPAPHIVIAAPSEARGLGPASGFVDSQERPPRQARG